MYNYLFCSSLNLCHFFEMFVSDMQDLFKCSDFRGFENFELSLKIFLLWSTAGLMSEESVLVSKIGN